MLKNNFDLSATEFRDALCVRYRKPLKRSFSKCDGCQPDFDLHHALSCKKCGLVTLLHNEIRDAVGDLASVLWKDVKREPVVKEPDVEKGTPALIVDLSIFQLVGFGIDSRLRRSTSVLQTLTLRLTKTAIP